MKIRYYIICCILFSLISARSFAQEFIIDKSTDQELIDGKIYYLHNVKAKETLYSISKSYNVPDNVILECNNKTNSNLSIGEIIIIPKYLGSKFYYHSMRKGETLYSVCKQMGVSLKDVYKENNNISDITDISVGTLIKIPENENTRAFFNAKKKEDKRKFKKSVDSLVNILTMDNDKKADFTEAKQMENVKPVKNVAITTAIVKDKKIDVVRDTRVKKNLNIALFLPFYLNMNDTINKSNNIALDVDVDSPSKKDIKIYNKSLNFINFYQGFLAACDSLRDKGYNVTINTFDTAKDIQTVKKTIEGLNFNDYDFIVGPPYAATFKIAADKAQAARTPIISPLSDNTEATVSNPFVYQINTSEETIFVKTAEYTYNKFKNANIVVVFPKNYQANKEAMMIAHLEDLMFAKNIHSKSQSINYTKISFDKYNLYGLKHVLKKNVENIIIVPSKDKSDIYTIIPNINSLSSVYDISLIGLPSWLRFTSLDPSTFFKLNTRILSPYFVNYEDTKTLNFINQYRTKYFAEPDMYSFRAYDIASYFVQVASKGSLMNANKDYYNYSLIQSCFIFEKDPNFLGKENKGLNVIHYNKDFSTTVEFFN